MTIDEYKSMSELFEDDIYDAISPETCVKNRNSYGGTSYNQVDMQLKLAKEIMDSEDKAVQDKDNKQVIVEV